MNTRIILADDHQIVRSGLRTLLEQHHDMKVVAEAGDGREALKLVQELSPDVVVMDVSMSNLNGMEATRQIVAEFPEVKIVALSMHSDKRFVTGMLKAGATAYLLKGCSFEELITAIRAVVADKSYLSPGISNIVIKGYIQESLSDSPSVTSVLTTREREVLQLLAEGKNTKDIADLLYVSVKTVETHRQHIMSKLDIRNLAELTRYALREGLTSL